MRNSVVTTSLVPLAVILSMVIATSDVVAEHDGSDAGAGTDLSRPSTGTICLPSRAQCPTGDGSKTYTGVSEQRFTCMKKALVSDQKKRSGMGSTARGENAECSELIVTDGRGA